jgi:hypothetical protein
MATQPPGSVSRSSGLPAKAVSAPAVIAASGMLWICYVTKTFSKRCGAPAAGRGGCGADVRDRAVILAWPVGSSHGSHRFQGRLVRLLAFIDGRARLALSLHLKIR